ncbi:hypothetical protein MKK88_05860 [Methylobacterium sp. E-005]|uniref:hypothetical protein n=1 Tax=Methylobacterium sp. E-005 TaxID=2836549 RepID=UPI001FB950F6|nr:hypothetical protein [Methylobacterium sp. E-005]MCJ2085520.1 hypothetical protein [Methylobacterium sp. E-005]
MTAIDAEIDNLVQAATFAKQVLRAQHRKHGAVVCQQAVQDLGDAVRRLQELRHADAALVRTFDEA